MQNLEAFLRGAMAAEINKKSTIIGRVTTKKMTVTISLLEAPTRRRRVMLLILPCLMIAGRL